MIQFRRFTRGHRGFAAGAALAASALFLSACTATPPSAPAATGVDTGAQIDEVTVALPGSVSSLYVGQEAGIINYYVASVSQEGLVKIAADGSIQPALAESWTQTDATTFVYQLREDATFQDGTPVTVDDVIFSITKAQDPEVSPNFSWLLAGIASAEKTAERELTITLASPSVSFQWATSTSGALYVTSQAFWEANEGKVGTSDGLILGSGPYRVTEYVPDSFVSFERVDTWWGGVPKVKSVRIEFIPDDNTRLLAMQSGEVDMAFNVPAAQAAQWEDLDNAAVRYSPDLSYVGLQFDTAIAPFGDEHVRKAIAHSIDRDAVVDKLLRGKAEVATALITPESIAAVYEGPAARAALAAVPQYDFDLDAAAAELAKSEFPDGFEAEITYPASGPQLGQAAQSLAQNLAKIGITLTVTEVPLEEWYTTLADGVHGLGFMWYFSTTGDPGELSSWNLGEGNASHYDNPDIAALLAQAAVETDQAKRAELLIETNVLQAADAIDLPLWWGQSATAFSNDLGMNDYSPFVFVSPWPAALYRAG